MLDTNREHNSRGNVFIVFLTNSYYLLSTCYVRGSLSTVIRAQDLDSLDSRISNSTY